MVIEINSELKKYGITCFISLIILTGMLLYFWNIDQKRDLKLAQLEAEQEVMADWAKNGTSPVGLNGGELSKLSYKNLVELVSPSVVTINVDKNSLNTVAQAQQIANQNAIPQKGGLSGSGIIVQRKGYVLTNHHVIHGGNTITVTVTTGNLTKSYEAMIVDEAPSIDMVILQINSNGMEIFNPATLGNSDFVSIGDEVLSIGSPFGLQQSVSFGIISNTSRTLSFNGVVYSGLIQTDAPINPGSSGGPLVNMKGEIIGINTAIYSTTNSFSGIGFSMPINKAKEYFAKFIENSANQIGSQAQTVALPPACATCPAPCFPVPGQPVVYGQQNNQAIGGLVRNPGWLYPDLPRMHVEVPINQYDPKQYFKNKGVPTTVAGPNWLCPMQGARAGMRVTASTITSVNTGNQVFLGIKTYDMDSNMKAQLNVPLSFGLFITEVVIDSPAFLGGLQQGDVVYRVDNHLVKDQLMIFNLMNGFKSGDRIKVTFFRQGKKMNSLINL